MNALSFVIGMMVGAVLGIFAMGLLAGGAERRERERRPCPR
jgi:gas vesicle protein